MDGKLKSKFDWNFVKDLPSPEEARRMNERFQKAITGKAKPVPRVKVTRDSQCEWFG